MKTSVRREVDLSVGRLQSPRKQLLFRKCHSLTYNRWLMRSVKTLHTQRSAFHTVPSVYLTKEFSIKATTTAEQIGPPNGSRKANGLIWKSLAVLGLLITLRILTPRLALANTAQSSGLSVGRVLKSFSDFFLHLDTHLSAIIAKYGLWTYAILFGIVFCETGLILTPLLPGDSLLFAAGAMSGLGKLNISYLFAVFIISAILGDAVNYAIGSWLGQKAVESKFISKSAIEETEAFFQKHGGKTIVLARFVPIVRTFAPFVAGVSHMAYQSFAAYNIGGAILWTVLFCGAGYFFGNLPFVEKNFSIVVLAIIVVSLVPTLIEFIAAKRRGKQ